MPSLLVRNKIDPFYAFLALQAAIQAAASSAFANLLGTLVCVGISGDLTGVATGVSIFCGDFVSVSVSDLSLVVK